MRVNVVITDRQAKRLHNQSIREQVPQALILRRAIAHYFNDDVGPLRQGRKPQAPRVRISWQPPKEN